MQRMLRFQPLGMARIAGSAGGRRKGMSKIKKVGFGYTVPKERYQEAAENIQKLGAMYAEYLRKKNFDGLGEQDAQELMADILLACTALLYVAEFAADKCHMVPLPGKDGKA